MVREAQCGIGTSDQTTNSLKPKPSLSAIYLYPALAMSYCTQHNTVGNFKVSFSQASRLCVSGHFRFAGSKSNFILSQISI